MKNESGITPLGRHVLVQPHEIEETTESGLIVARRQDLDRHQQAQTIGTFIEAGPDAWIHSAIEIYRLMDGEMKHAETRVERFSEDFASPGDRVSFGKFQGQDLLGKDGKRYRLLNDTSILSHVDEEVKFLDIEARQPLSGT